MKPALYRAQLMVLAIALGAASVHAEEFRGRIPRQWLDGMNAAFAETDYDGVFSYYNGIELSTLRVTHLVQDGVQRERLIHLNGEPREIIRHGDEVACILQPGDEMLELESSIPSGPFARAFTRSFDGIGDVYSMAFHGIDRIADREAATRGAPIFSTVCSDLSPKRSSRQTRRTTATSRGRSPACQMSTAMPWVT